ncbi:MAG TPA: tryptophan halogenase family protein [Cellvibrionaceae bacterium]
MVKVTANPIQKFVIVGGGTAGWIAAATLGNIFKGTDVSIEVVESPEVGIIGVGEATVPIFLDTLRGLGINEAEFIRATQATFKWGIEFADWHTVGERYFHSFGPVGRKIDGHDFYQCWLKCRAEGDTTPFMAHAPEAVLASQQRFFLPFKAANTPLATARYALHLDATLVARYLAEFCRTLGVIHTRAHVAKVLQHANGFIKSLKLRDGGEIAGDFFIDCTGFAGLLIEQTLQAGYHDWSDFLPCNRAVTVQSERAITTTPYTVAKAREAGWTWRIPLQHRTGNGYVFCSRYVSDDVATATLLNAIDTPALNTPRVIEFTTGIRQQPWLKNCLALGLAQGFLEPLESTAIHLVSKTLAQFVRSFPALDCDPLLVSEFNRRVLADYTEIRDFLVMHYCTTARTDTPFWRDCNAMKLPDSLQHKLNIFHQTGAVIAGVEDFFGAASWQMVLTGMERIPAHYNPTLDALNADQLRQSLAAGKQALARIAEAQPLHDDFIREYCAAPEGV